MKYEFQLSGTDCETISFALMSAQEVLPNPYLKDLILRFGKQKSFNSKDICIIYEALQIQSSNCAEACRSLPVPEQFRFLTLKSNSDKLIEKLKPFADEAEKNRF